MFILPVMRDHLCRETIKSSVRFIQVSLYYCSVINHDWDMSLEKQIKGLPIDGGSFLRKSISKAG